MFTAKCFEPLSRFLVYPVARVGRHVETTLAQRVAVFTGYPNSILRPHVDSEVVVFGFNDKNFNYFNASRLVFPKMRVFACLSHPAEYHVQYTLYHVPVIAENKRYWQFHPNTTVVSTDAEFLHALRPYLKSDDIKSA